MDIFKLIGSIFIKNEDANTQIDNTASKAKEMSTTIGSAMEKAGDKITGVGKALAPVSLAVGAMLGASTKSASDFTDGMAKMSTLFDTSKTSVEDLSKQFLDLSNKTGISATELAEAGYQALSAGQTVDQVGKFVETAGNLAKAGFTSSTTAVDVLTTAMNAYGEGAGSAEQIANKLVRTQNLGKTTVDELASSMGKIIPTASSMGVNINNLTSGYVSLTKQGIATAESTTYMNSMLNELGDSGTTLGGVLKDKTGKSFQDLMSEGYSLADVLQITKDYADENNIAYNELWSSAEAGKAGLAILNGGVEEFNSTVETMKSDVDDVGGALDKLDTPSKKIQRSLNRVKNSGIELGTTILTSLTPAIDKVSGVIEKATDWFNNLSDGTKQMIATIGGIIAVVSPVLVIGGTVISTITKILPLITMIKTGITGLSAVIGLIASPIGIVVVAIGALIAVFVTLYNTNENFRNLVNNVWSEIQNKIQTVIQVVTGVIQSGLAFIQGGWTGAWDSIRQTAQNVWNRIRNIIRTGINLLKSLIKVGLNVIKSTWTSGWNFVKSKAQTIWNNIKNIIKSAITAVRTTISNVLNSIRTTFSNIWNSIRTTTSNAFNNIRNTVSNAINNVRSRITSGLNSAKSSVSSIFTSIVNKIKSTMNSAKNAVSNAIDKIKSKFKFHWSLPHLKLPSISVSGSFKLNPPSVPHFSLSWHKDQMTDPMLMTKPTIFGYNPKTGVAHAGGEAGNEILYGHKNLMEDIRNASGSAELIEVFNDHMSKIYNILVAYLPQLAEKDLTIDGETLVGKITPMVDRRLGIIATHKGRGN